MNRRQLRDEMRAQAFANSMESMFGSWQVQVTKGGVRVGDDERDAAARQLGEHYASGRLERWEYDERLDAALAAKTRGELARVFRDLPGAVPAVRPKPPPRAGRPRGFRPPLFPLVLILIGVAVFTDAWWVLLVGLGAVLLLRRAGGRASACGGAGRQARR